MIILKNIIPSHTFNTIMNYLDNIENIRDIYIKFCEYLDSEPERDAFDKYITERYIQKTPTRYLIYIYVQFTQSNNFTNFKNIYLAMNPDLMIYEEEFKNHRFNFNMFREEFEEINNNILVLK